MLLHIFKLLLSEHAGRHIAVLDALVGQNGGRQPGAQIGLPQALDVLPHDRVAALPQGFEGSFVHAAQAVVQRFRTVKELRQVAPRQRVRVDVHLFRRGDDDAHAHAPPRYARISSALVSGFTLGITFSITPCSSIR